MTMIAALVIEKGFKPETIILTGDSRVTFNTHCGKLESFTETAQKVFLLTDNVFIGFAGDFYNVNDIINKFRKKLLKPELGKPLLYSKGEIIVRVLAKWLKQNWSSQYADSSIFIVIRDTTDNRVKLFQIDSPNFEHKILKHGLHLIGGDEVDKAKFEVSYRKHRDYLKEITEDYQGISILSGFTDVNSNYINGLNPCYFVSLQGWTTFNHAYSDDGGENWIADVSLGNGNWERQVNGRQSIATNLNYKEVQDTRNKEKRK